MIYVFKTSVKTKMKAKRLTWHIDKTLPEAKWNFDLGDCDKILRIDREENIAIKITGLLNRQKFHCEKRLRNKKQGRHEH
jgi:hypothetical protein